MLLQITLVILFISSAAWQYSLPLESVARVKSGTWAIMCVIWYYESIFPVL